jgi:hypothetical protein
MFEEYSTSRPEGRGNPFIHNSFRLIHEFGFGPGKRPGRRFVRPPAGRAISVPVTESMPRSGPAAPSETKGRPGPLRLSGRSEVQSLTQLENPPVVQALFTTAGGKATRTPVGPTRRPSAVHHRQRPQSRTQRAPSPGRSSPPAVGTATRTMPVPCRCPTYRTVSGQNGTDPPSTSAERLTPEERPCNRRTQDFAGWVDPCPSERRGGGVRRPTSAI